MDFITGLLLFALMDGNRKISEFKEVHFEKQGLFY